MGRKKFFCSFTTFLVLFLSGVVFGFEARDGSALTLNAPVSREFKTGERHFFSLTAAENEAIEITCERGGVDIGLTVFAPTGEKIAVSHAPGGFAGFDRVFFLALQAGEYRIEVTSRRAGNIAGNYTILLKDKRAASEADLTRAAAARLSGEAREVLFGAENRRAKATQAYEKLEKALALYEKASDLPGQAETSFQLAMVSGAELGLKGKAIELYEKALEIWSKIDNETGRAIGLTQLADEMRDYDIPDRPRSYFRDKAQGYFEEGLALHRKHNDKFDEAAALTSLCRLYNDTGNFQRGFETCRESLRLAGGSDPQTDFQTYANLASLSGNSGDFENAVKFNRLALERFEIVKDYVSPYRKSFIKGNLGGIFIKQKNFADAEKELREAYAIAEEVERRSQSGYILVRLAMLLFELNRLPEALEAAEKGVEIYRQLDPVKIQAAINILGKIHFALGRIDEARTLFSEAVEINRRNKDRYAEADSLYNLARLESQAGNLETAHQDIDLAISLSEIIRAQLLGKNQRTTYLSILKKYYELEIELLVRLHEKNSDAGYAEQAWQRHERIRARNLMESLIEGGLNLSEFAPPDFFAKEQVMLEAIAAAELKRSEAAKTKNAALQKSAESELTKKLADYGVFQEDFRKKNPHFSAVNQPKTFSLAEAQKLLDENTAIIEFALGESQSYVWVICKNEFKIAKLPAKNNLLTATRELYAALTDRAAKDESAITEKSRILSRKILSPVAKDLGDIKKLVIVADGGLQLIPFGVLSLTPETADYRQLVSEVETVYAPSFASIVYLRENQANRAKSNDKMLAVFADPIFQADDERLMINKPTKRQKNDPKNLSGNLALAMRDFGLDRLARLPFSGVEAREISRLAPEQTFLALGADASRQKFLRGDFNDYRYLHFATHGFLNQQNPDLSGLVLSLYDENRNVQNGFLRVIDLYSMRLNSELVVLSACQTALGKEIDGEGIVGLTRGFMYAGASGVVSSLWKVEDAATAELMKRFYRAIIKENQTPLAALRTAKLEMRRIPRFANPRFWAGFTLNGEWQ